MCIRRQAVAAAAAAAPLAPGPLVAVHGAGIPRHIAMRRRPAAPLQKVCQRNILIPAVCIRTRQAVQHAGAGVSAVLPSRGHTTECSPPLPGCRMTSKAALPHPNPKPTQTHPPRHAVSQEHEALARQALPRLLMGEAAQGAPPERHLVRPAVGLLAPLHLVLTQQRVEEAGGGGRRQPAAAVAGACRCFWRLLRSKAGDASWGQVWATGHCSLDVSSNQC